VVFHIPDFLWGSECSTNLMRLSFKERRTSCLVECNEQEIRGISQKTSEMWGNLKFVGDWWLKDERSDDTS
jgi:hypothetical protein